MKVTTYEETFEITIQDGDIHVDGYDLEAEKVVSFLTPPSNAQAFLVALYDCFRSDKPINPEAWLKKNLFLYNRAKVKPFEISNSNSRLYLFSRYLKGYKTEITGIASNPHSGGHLLDLILAKYGRDSEVCQALCANVNIPLEILTHLSFCPDLRVCRRVVDNPLVSDEILSRMMLSSDLDLRYAAKHRKNTLQEAS